MTIIHSHSSAGMEWSELTALYRAASLGNKSAASLETAFTNSRYCCFALEHGLLVGAGRVLADGADCAYLCDVAVLPDHQGRGIGREIVARLVTLSRGTGRSSSTPRPARRSFTAASVFAACAPPWPFSPTRSRRLPMGIWPKANRGRAREDDNALPGRGKNMQQENTMHTFFRLVMALVAALLVGFTPLARAAALKAATQVPGYYRLMLGQFEITALYDGAI